MIAKYKNIFGPLNNVKLFGIIVTKNMIVMLLFSDLGGV